MQLIDLTRVAELLQVERLTVYRHAAGIRECKMLEGFPRPAISGRGKKMLWVDADVQDWISSLRTFRSTEPTPAPAPEQVDPPRRGPGRPRKAASGEQEGGAV